MEVAVSACHGCLSGIIVVRAVVLHIGIKQSLERLDIIVSCDLLAVLPLHALPQGDLEDIAFLHFGRILAVKHDVVLCKVSCVGGCYVLYSGSCLIGPLIDLILGIFDTHADKRSGDVIKNTAVRVRLPGMGIPVV